MKVFFDSSVILAGMLSDRGGSARTLQLAARGELEGWISNLVLLEVMHNLESKFKHDLLPKFLNFLAVSKFKKIDIKSESELFPYLGITHEKDVHVIAASSISECEFLLTLDRKHLLSISSPLPFRVLTPGQFLKEFFAVGVN